MRPKLFLAILTLSLLSLTGKSIAQEGQREDFGVFHAICATDQMTDVRTCYIYLTEAGLFEIRFYSSSAIIGNNVLRMRVDHNPAITGDCKKPLEKFPFTKVAGQRTICHFYDRASKGSSPKLLEELEAGKTLRVELIDGTSGEYELAPFFLQALKARNDMERVGSPQEPAGAAL